MSPAHKKKGGGRAAGEIRQSQIITTFGPGAMVDLPNHSIIVGGLDHWHGELRPVYEERLAARVAELLELPGVGMYAPPVDSPDPAAPRTGITSFVFPCWFLAQVDETWEVGEKTYRTRPLVPWERLIKGKYLTPERKKVAVVPVRFVQACVNGHISDVDWYAFAHAGGDYRCRRLLWLDEGGSGSDFTDIFVRCSCGRRRPLSDAAVKKGGPLGKCRGTRPWLGPHASEDCVSAKDERKSEQNRLLVRSATNAWFSQILSVIALPDRDAKLKDAVDAVFEDYLQYAEDAGDVKRERRKKPVAAALEDFGDADVWAEVERRKTKTPQAPKKIKEVEIETLLASPHEVGEDVPEGDFHARAIPLDDLAPWLRAKLDRIVLVHRLREVSALVGFTRFESAMPDIDGELDIDVQRAALALEPAWVPAIENRGEGIFLSFRKDAVNAWTERDGAVWKRGIRLEDGFNAWRERKKAAQARFPGLPYIMLHSFSHLLITALSLECGYSATAIRERIYASPTAGYGILLYTGTPGSEGTLGGLVEQGRRMGPLIARALETGRLCSNDPVCAQHAPDNVHEERFLHGAACHGCLLIAEPSCERRNEFLDRALVVPTVEGLGAEFFKDAR